MSEYTSIYLRRKGEELPAFRHYPSHEDIGEKSKERVLALYHEVEEYNAAEHEKLGCELFYLSTTPSRKLEVLPWTQEPKPLTSDLLQEILSFYAEEIEGYRNIISERRSDMERFERRIVQANADLYDKIEDEIRGCRTSIEECEEEIEELEFYQSKFSFLKGIMAINDNSDKYELIYTKC